MKQIRRHITYANVMSSLAVFMILGGATAFAAVQKIGANEIKANSIKTGKIVKEAVTAGKIKNGAVIEAKIGDAAVTTNKLADNAVTTAKIANDAVTGSKIAKNTITGANVNAASLGVVPEATVGSPRAYAYISAAGTVSPDAPSRGIGDGNVKNESAGTYCFNGLPFAPQAAQVTGDSFGDNDNVVSMMIGNRSGIGDESCPGLEQVAVQISDISAAALQNDDFFIVIW